MTRVPLILLATALLRAPLAAQDKSVTLADAIALAQRTQPAVIQAQSQVRTSQAQRLASRQPVAP